jgi:hypothetical protein
MSNPPGCKTQLYKRHVLADSGVNLIHQRTVALERFAVLDFTGLYLMHACNRAGWTLYTPRATSIAGFDLLAPQAATMDVPTVICRFTIGSFPVPEGFLLQQLAIGVVLGAYGA